MKLLKNCVYFEDKKILALADLHIGYEARLIEAGVLLPKQEKKEILDELGEIFNYLKKQKLEIKEIVICGDFKHKFGGFGLEEWKEVKEILDFLSGFGKIILLRGNHDSYLKALEGKYEVRDFYIKNNTAFFHGDALYKECLGTEIFVVGHFHPIFKLREGAKTESFKCFLVGKWKAKKVIILPAFTSSSEGGMTPERIEEVIRKEGPKLLGGFNIKNFEVYMPGERVDEVYGFGAVKNLKKLD